MTTKLASAQLVDPFTMLLTSQSTIAVQDYCYTLNVPKMTWRMHTLAAPLGVSGPRSHHSGEWRVEED